MPLLECILSKRNMRRAFEQVMRNKGSGGVDGIEIEGFKSHVDSAWFEVKAEIMEGSYQPSAVRRLEIPKPDGGTRILGIPPDADQSLISSPLLS